MKKNIYEKLSNRVYEIIYPTLHNLNKPLLLTEVLQAIEWSVNYGGFYKFRLNGYLLDKDDNELLFINYFKPIKDQDKEILEGLYNILENNN